MNEVVPKWCLITSKFVSFAFVHNNVTIHVESWRTVAPCTDHERYSGCKDTKKWSYHGSPAKQGAQDKMSLNNTKLLGHFKNMATAKDDSTGCYVNFVAIEKDLGSLGYSRTHLSDVWRGKAEEHTSWWSTLRNRKFHSWSLFWHKSNRFYSWHPKLAVARNSSFSCNSVCVEYIPLTSTQLHVYACTPFCEREQGFVTSLDLVDDISGIVGIFLDFYKLNHNCSISALFC